MDSGELRYDKGTILLQDFPSDVTEIPFVKYDERTGCHRTPAYHYKNLRQQLTESSINYQDKVLNPIQNSLDISSSIDLRPYQLEALKDWKTDGQGTIGLTYRRRKNLRRPKIYRRGRQTRIRSSSYTRSRRSMDTNSQRRTDGTGHFWLRVSR